MPYTHARMHMHTHIVHTHTHTYTHTHVYTHAHTRTQINLQHIQDANNTDNATVATQKLLIISIV